MEYTIYLNESTFFILTYIDGQYTINDFGDGVKYNIKVTDYNGELVVSYLDKPICYINTKEYSEHPVHYYSNHLISSTEVRAVNGYEINKYYGRDTGDQVTNLVSLRHSNDPHPPVSPATDLHTHFIEMLDGKDFISVILQHIDHLPVDYNGNLIGRLQDDQGNFVQMEDLISKVVFSSETEELLKLSRELEVSLIGQREFMEISIANSKRNNLVTYAAKRLLERDEYSDLTLGKAKAIIYTDLLIKALEVLKGQGVEYTEISYSNDSTISKMLDLVKGKIPEGIRFNILLGADRRKLLKPGYANETIKNLRRLLKKGEVRGLDLMGEEEPFNGIDLDVNMPTSYAHLMNEAIPLLNQYPDSVLRLHMGENPQSVKNPVESLRVIKSVVENNALVIPPPYIRLGHAVYFDYANSIEYLDLLGRLGVTIEINASSNYALNNVSRLIDIPYKWYREHKIPVVLGTDGHGMYRTSPIQEVNIAGGVDPQSPTYVVESEQNKGVIGR